VNNVLDQSHQTDNRSSQVLSEIAASMLYSPKPEKIENIPKPHVGFKPKKFEVEAKPTPKKLLETTKRSKVNERTKSAQRFLTHNKLEKMEITNYKEKRSEHRNKQRMITVENLSKGKNLMSELRNIEVQNSQSFLQSPSKPHFANIFEREKAKNKYNKSF
jgi:hypothetical protein